MSASRQYCTFLVGDLLMGFDVLEVQEVLRGRELTPVPLAPPAIRGLINLRGQIVTAIDLRRRLSLPDRAAADLAMIVVVRLGDEVTAFLADKIGDVIEVDSDSFELPPETLAPVVQTLVIGVHKLPKQLLHILDAGRCAAIAA
jgi:purine-binding chemotaxis protein CheW